MIGSDQQTAIWDCIANESCNIIVEALAGTGKTTTIVEGLKRLPPPAPTTGRVVGGASYAFVAFNKSIATELQRRVPPGVVASTMHSMGFAAVRQHVKRTNVDQDKVFDMVHSNDPALPWAMVRATSRLVSLCKMNLIDGEPADLRDFMLEFSLDIPEKFESRIFDAVPEVIRSCRRDMATIDYDDMIWLPVINNLSMPRYDVVMADEVQDFNRCQQALVVKAGKRIVAVGDRHQSIYGFMGADPESMNRMHDILDARIDGVKVFPLTVTRRCPPVVVELAQSIVPAFECDPVTWAAYREWQVEVQASSDWDEDAGVDPLPDIERDYQFGVIQQNYEDHPAPGHMVLCRTNAPLISYAYNLISLDVPLKIQGRDLGKSLAELIQRLAPDVADLALLLDAVDQYRSTETQRIMRKPGNKAETAKQALDDKCDCIEALCQGLNTVSDVLVRIGRIFDDVSATPENYVLLSSVHRAKGLEAQYVHILEPQLMPHPSAKSASEVQQEMNLKYVAITRTKHELLFHPATPKR